MNRVENDNRNLKIYKIDIKFNIIKQKRSKGNVSKNNKKFTVAM